jgi:hypothetical protein
VFVAIHLGQQLELGEVFSHFFQFELVVSQFDFELMVRVLFVLCGEESYLLVMRVCVEMHDLCGQLFGYVDVIGC